MRFGGTRGLRTATFSRHAAGAQIFLQLNAIFTRRPLFRVMLCRAARS
jgi:hypothetical protein